jgi:hypothetical protein
MNNYAKYGGMAFVVPPGTYILNNAEWDVKVTIYPKNNSLVPVRAEFKKLK